MENPQTLFIEQENLERKEIKEQYGQSNGGSDPFKNMLQSQSTEANIINEKENEEYKKSEEGKKIEEDKQNEGKQNEKDKQKEEENLKFEIYFWDKCKILHNRLKEKINYLKELKRLFEENKKINERNKCNWKIKVNDDTNLYFYKSSFDCIFNILNDLNEKYLSFINKLNLKMIQYINNLLKKIKIIENGYDEYIVSGIYR